MRGPEDIEFGFSGFGFGPSTFDNDAKPNTEGPKAETKKRGVCLSIDRDAEAFALVEFNHVFARECSFAVQILH